MTTPKKPRYRKDLSSRDNEIVNLVYMEGQTLTEVAEQFGLSFERVRQICANSGFPTLREWRQRHPPLPRGFGEGDPDLVQRVIVDRQAGMSWPKLAKKYNGESWSQVYCAIKRQCLKRGFDWPIKAD